MSVRSRFALFAAAAVVSLSATAAHAQVLPGPRDDTDARISQYRMDVLREANATLTAWRDAWAEDDVRALVRLYDRKAVVQLPGDVTTRQGVAGVETALRAQLPGVGRIELGLLDAEVSGDLLFIFQSFMLSPVPGDSASAEVEPVTGTSTLVMKRERGGWRIRAQMFLPTPRAVAATPAPSSAAPAPQANGDTN
ncbi:MAG TPA: DUF4440 domain-containing protein [Longimicrobium sp.]|nr:DUF4440 domain-containing protein [Longimicrobium sp.]